MKQTEDKINTPGPAGAYCNTPLLIFTWLALLCLTGVTVWVAGIDLGRYGFTVNILIASVKAGLVLSIFMQLKHESLFFKMILLLIILTLTAIMALTFLDVLYR